MGRNRRQSLSMEREVQNESCHRNDVLFQIPSYTGDPDALAPFIRQITTLTKVNNWSDEVALAFLLSKLDGPALRFYTQSPTCVAIETLDEAVTALSKFFSEETTPLSNAAQFQNIALLPGESIRNLAFRLETLAAKTYPSLKGSPALNQVLSVQFLSALPNEFREQILFEPTDDFKRLVEKVNKKAMAKQTMHLLHTNNIQTLPIGNVGQSESVVQLQTQVKELTEQVRRMTQQQTMSQMKKTESSVEDPTQLICTHMTESSGDDNRQTQFISPREPIVVHAPCAYCGKSNHIMANCYMFKSQLREMCRYSRPSQHNSFGMSRGDNQQSNNPRPNFYRDKKSHPVGQRPLNDLREQGRPSQSLDNRSRPNQSNSNGGR